MGSLRVDRLGSLRVVGVPEVQHLRRVQEERREDLNYPQAGHGLRRLRERNTKEEKKVGKKKQGMPL